MEKLLDIMEEIVPGEDVKGSMDLIEDGILDSFAILNLISEIEDAYGVEIPVAEVIPENFHSVEAILKLIEKHK